MINHLKEERSEYSNIEWLSSTGVSTPIVEMSNSYLINVLRKVTQKSMIAQQLAYVEEFQLYEGIHYSAWVRYLYNEYLYRKHSDIVIEESVADTNPVDNTDPAIIATEYFSNVESNNGVYKIS